MTRRYLLSFPRSNFSEAGGGGMVPPAHHIPRSKKDLDLSLGYCGSTKTFKRVCLLDPTIFSLFGVLGMFFIFNAGRYGRTVCSTRNDIELVVQHNDDTLHDQP